MSDSLNWLLEHFVETAAAALGLLAIVLQIKQNAWYWLVSMVMVAMYIAVYIDFRLYADMLLQIYYLIMSFYGWWSWVNGKNKKNSKANLPVTIIERKLWIPIVLITVGLFFLLGVVMSRFTNSDVPWLDSLVAALSFVATWMLARKKLENWIWWIVANSISIGLYIYKEMYPTLILFIVLTILAFVGYFEWKKDLSWKKT